MFGALWDMRFGVQGTTLVVELREPDGSTKLYRQPLKPRLAAALGRRFKDEQASREELARLTPAELAERYQECMGS